MARVIPFPVARRSHQIVRTATYMASLNPRHAESHLREQIRRLEQSLVRKGVEPELVQVQVTSYEAAVRAAMWRLVLIGGAA